MIQLTLFMFKVNRMASDKSRNLLDRLLMKLQLFAIYLRVNSQSVLKVGVWSALVSFLVEFDYLKKTIYSTYICRRSTGLLFAQLLAGDAELTEADEFR